MRKSPLNLQQLNFFIAICEEGSMTAAAFRLGVAQPALSVAIAKLEAALAVELLIREPRGIVLTAAGERLLRRAYDIISLTQATVQEIEGLTQEPHGEVAIGLPSSTAAVLAIPLIERISVTFPGIKLRVVEAFSGYLWKWLEQGEIDLAIVFNRIDTMDITCTPMAREAMHLISRRTARAATTPVRAEHLGKYPLAMPSHASGFRDTVQAHAEKYGAALNVTLEIDAGHQLVKLVASGKFNSILAPCAVADEIAQKQVVARPIEPPLHRTISLARQKVQRSPAPVGLVADELVEECRRLIGEGGWMADWL